MTFKLHEAYAISPDIPYDECLQLCEQLDLIERVWHGEHDYGRLTQKGHNVFFALIRLATHSTDPENKLKIT